MADWRTAPERSAILLVDVQEKLLPVMTGREALLKKLNLLLQSAATLSVPVYVSEQVPEKLGVTDPQLLSSFTPAETMAKNTFSAVEALPTGTDIPHWVVCGIEAHICVRQTVFDLKQQGRQVSVVADAVASRNSQDCQIALDEMRASGVRVMTVESLVFEWLGSSQNENFRAISRAVRTE